MWDPLPAQEALDVPGLRPDLGHAGDATLPGSRLLDQEVVPGALSAHDLPGPGQAEPLGRPAVRLHLRHVPVFLLRTARPDGQALRSPSPTPAGSGCGFEAAPSPSPARASEGE